MATEGVITRFAPSPTGYLHIGGARTALFNWLFTRRRGGKFILRIEDTDQLRSTEASTRAILDAMTWLGLNWDEGPYFQAERVEIHREMVQRMIREGKAYCCNCTPEALEDKRKKALAQGRKPKYDGTCRDKGLSRTPDAAVRFRCPDVGLTVLDDLIKGRITFSNDELDDLIIERSDGYPTYNFAVVVDDAQMHITHVIRGDDHVNNTPKQILLYEALGFPVPQFGHVPMILGADRARLSKRHGATSVMAYRDMGYLPEALVNYLVRLGWSHGDQEIFDREELGRLFSLDAVGKSAAIFNPEKLLWLNQHYLKVSPADRLYPEMTIHWNQRQIVPHSREYAEDVIRSLQSRSRTLVDMAEAGRFYFQQEVTYDPAAADTFLKPEYAQTLARFGERLSGLADCTREAVEALLRAVAEERGVKMKFVAQPLRVALTGGTVSPGIDEVVTTLGRDKVLERIRRAVAFIGRAAAAGAP